MGPKAGTYFKIKSTNSPHEPCHWSKTRCPCFCRIEPRYKYTRICLTLLDFQLFFCRFFSQSEALHNCTLCPFIRMPTYGETLSTLHPPHLTPYMYACTPPPRYIQYIRTTYIRIYGYELPVAPWPDTSSSATPGIEVGSIYPILLSIQPRNFVRPYIGTNRLRGHT